jgi:N-methylhydantoinase B
MLKISEIHDVAFDGVNQPYVPPKVLRIAPKLRLHREYERELDPVTFEVIRHNLWNINEEHGATIQRISGSPVAVYALDLNPSILTEDAEFVFFGPYMQYMSGVTDTQVKWVLENRSDNPGIRDGDMFLANDPWVGAAHQMDVMLICPVFWEGELFCWVTNCLHQYDIGGITPGSFCPSARSAFDEGLLIPPIKIIENEQIRRDIEELYLRSSRKPEMVALDFRAQMAGNIAARKRVLQLIERYGDRVVKGVMKRLLDNGEQAFLAKMRRLPDGTWRDRSYVECCRPGDRGVYPVAVTLHKRGDRLIFENEGTALQQGAMNATYSGWRGSIMVAVNQLLCWDQFFSVGGALRHVEFDPTPGTLNCASFPASVSTAPTQAMEISLYPAYNVLSKLLYSDPEMRKDVMCIGGTSQWPTTIFRGTDQWGERFGYLLIDPIGGAIGAFSGADGISTGGQSRTPICKLPNVEHTEQSFPLLFLYRKEVADSGGPGKYRGGLSAESCFIPHNTSAIVQDTLSSGNAIPTSTGMMGGYPGTTNSYRFVRNSDIGERLSTRNMIEDIGDLTGEQVTLQLRQEGFEQRPNDVYAVLWSAAGGFGDPTERDPQLVLDDWLNDAVTRASAEDIYGVLIDEATASVDDKGTAQARALKRRQRVERYRQPRRVLGGELLMRVTENMNVMQEDGEAYFACVKCNGELGPLSANYKSTCIQENASIKHAVPLSGDPARFIDAAPVFRQFFCPTCGALIENEVAMDSDPVLQDIELRPKLETPAEHMAASYTEVPRKRRAGGGAG